MPAGLETSKKNFSKHSSAPYAARDVDTIAQITSFFGFIPIKTPRITQEDIEKVVSLRGSGEKKEDQEQDLHTQPEEKAALLRIYLEHNMVALPHPLMLYYKKPCSGLLSERKKSSTYQCGLDIIGTTNSVAEALTIKTLYAILSEQGFEHMFLEINTLGDKESVAHFERELCSYVKKNINNVPLQFRTEIKKNPFELFRNTHEECKEIREHAPKPMNFLSEQSIEHFKEVLEYLETLNIPYNINEYLIGDKNYCSQTIFKIKGSHNIKKDEIVQLASGCRHNHFSKKIGFKKDIPIMSAMISFKKPQEKSYKITIRRVERPQFYFIQLGFRARLKSLHIIDTLRKAGIPVYHSLTKDKFLNQLTTAENLKLSHLIIVGQKEALDLSLIHI
mgnify:CR=1 FL=1